MTTKRISGHFQVFPEDKAPTQSFAPGRGQGKRTTPERAGRYCGWQCWPDWSVLKVAFTKLRHTVGKTSVLCSVCSSLSPPQIRGSGRRIFLSVRRNPWSRRHPSHYMGSHEAQKDHIQTWTLYHLKSLVVLKSGLDTALGNP